MLIEALPPIFSLEQLVCKLEVNPIYSQLERKKDIDYRIQAITRLINYVTILIKHIEIEKKLSILIRRGYASKHVGTPDFIRKINFTSNLINNKWVKDKLKEIKCFFNNANTSMLGFTLIGISGGGKSTAVNRILSMYPQCIVHTEYKNDKFIFKQLVWIKIDCSHNGSTKGLCKKFFKEVDSILGSDYDKLFGNQRNSVDTMIAAMAHIVQIYAVGVIIIDEIQHLANIKEGSEKVLNFLVTLENELKIPIVYVGTYKALDKVLGQDFRQARRSSGIGEIEWTRMDEDDEWREFMKNMWKYQWTKIETPLTDKIMKAFYNNTMGITERVISLYIAVQIQAILSGEEKITVDLINNVFKENMKLTAPMITALRTNNMDLLKKYDDIRPFDREKFVENSRNTNEYKERLKKYTESADRQIMKKKVELEDNILISMEQFGFKENEIKKVINSIIKEHGLGKNLRFYMREVGKYIKIHTENDNDMQSKKGEGINRNKEVDEKNFYDELKKEGKIKSMEEDFGNLK